MYGEPGAASSGEPSSAGGGDTAGPWAGPLTGPEEVGCCLRGVASESGSGAGATAVGMLVNSILVAIGALEHVYESHLWLCRWGDFFLVAIRVVNSKHVWCAMLVDDHLELTSVYGAWASHHCLAGELRNHRLPTSIVTTTSALNQRRVLRSPPIPHTSPSLSHSFSNSPHNEPPPTGLGPCMSPARIKQQQY